MTVKEHLRAQIERDKVAWNALSPGIRKARENEMAQWPGIARLQETTDE